VHGVAGVVDMGKRWARGVSRFTSVFCILAIVSSDAVLAAEQTPVVAKPGHAAKLLPLGRGALAAALANEKQLPELKRKYPLQSHPKSYFPLPICAFEGGLCGAVDKNGRTVVAPEFDWVSVFQEGRAIVIRGGRYGFVAANGRVIAEPKYDRVGAFLRGFTQVELGNKMGVIDRQGHEVVAPDTYGFAAAFGDNSFWVTKERKICDSGRREVTPDGGVSITMSSCRQIEDAYPFANPSERSKRSGENGSTIFEVVVPSGNFSLIDRAGKEIRPAHFTDALMFDRDNRDLAWAKGPAAWGLLRSDGRWQVEPRYEAVRPLIEGFAAVKLNNKWGFVDRAGKLVIEPKFDQAYFFEMGHAIVSQAGLFGFIDTKGRWVVEPKFDQVRFLRGNFLSASRGKDWGLADRTGKWIVEPGYNTVSPHEMFVTKDPKWEVRKNEKGGMIDQSGKLVLAPVLDANPQFCDNGRFFGQINKSWHLYAPDGTELAPGEGELQNANACKGPFTYKLGDKFGFVDDNMKPLMPAKFESATGFLIKLDGKFGLLNRDMTWRVQPKYEALQEVGGGRFLAKVDGKFGLLNRDQSWQVKPAYEALQYFSGDYALAQLDGKSGVLNIASGKWIVSASYDAICAPSGIMIEIAGKRGFIDSKGKILIDPKFYRIGIQQNAGLVPFQETPDSKWGFADLAGNIVIEAKYENQSFFQDGIAWVRTPNELCPIDRRGVKIPSMACVEAKEPAKVAPRFECKIGLGL
jgi:WG containing repeat